MLVDKLYTEKEGNRSLGLLFSDKKVEMPDEGVPTELPLLINGPPSDSRCEVCKKHVDELEPFGGPGEPLVGDFTGAKLVKTWRSFCGCVGSSWECRDCIIQSSLELDIRHENLSTSYLVDVLKEDFPDLFHLYQTGEFATAYEAAKAARLWESETLQERHYFQVGLGFKEMPSPEERRRYRERRAVLDELPF